MRESNFSITKNIFHHIVLFCWLCFHIVLFCWLCLANKKPKNLKKIDLFLLFPQKPKGMHRLCKIVCSNQIDNWTHDVEAVYKQCAPMVGWRGLVAVVSRVAVGARAEPALLLYTRRPLPKSALVLGINKRKQDCWSYQCFQRFRPPSPPPLSLSPHTHTKH